MDSGARNDEVSSGRHHLRGCSRVSTARFPFGTSASPRSVGRPYRKDSQRRSPRAPKRAENRRMARRLMRARRIAHKADGQKNPRGRPSRIAIVQPVISDLVAKRKWNPTMGMKALTRDVNRAGRWSQHVSQDTVTRALDRLHEQTKDRLFVPAYIKHGIPYSGVTSCLASLKQRKASGRHSRSSRELERTRQFLNSGPSRRLLPKNRERPVRRQCHQCPLKA